METQSRKITVELLTEKDLDWFVNVAAINMLRDELKRPELICKDRIYELATKSMQDKTAFVAKCGNINIGAISGFLTPNLFNPNILTLAEIFWYVMDEYRNTRAGLLLLKAFTVKGEEIADETTMCLLIESPVSTASLEKRGYELKELSFRKASAWRP